MALLCQSLVPAITAKDYVGNMKTNPVPIRYGFRHIRRTSEKENVLICQNPSCNNEVIIDNRRGIGKKIYCSTSCGVEANSTRKRHMIHRAYPYTTKDGFRIFSKEDEKFDRRVRQVFS